MELGHTEEAAGIGVSTLEVDSPAVQSHLTMLQGVIGRLAANSASCKAWCIALVSALAVVAAESNNIDLLLVASLPIFLFGMLDAYYLGLERRFRRSYETFVRKLHGGSAKVDDAFAIAPDFLLRGLLAEALEALASFSIWPFYLGMAAILIILGMRLG